MTRLLYILLDRLHSQHERARRPSVDLTIQLGCAMSFFPGIYTYIRIIDRTPLHTRVIDEHSGIPRRFGPRQISPSAADDDSLPRPLPRDRRFSSLNYNAHRNWPLVYAFSYRTICNASIHLVALFIFNFYAKPMTVNAAISICQRCFYNYLCLMLLYEKRARSYLSTQVERIL